MTVAQRSDTAARVGHPYRVENGITWFGYRHARDIPDDVFLDSMQIASVERAQLMNWPRPLPANRWDIAAVLATGHVGELGDEVPGVPPKVVLAKANRLVGRRLIRGCTCGCRGDFEATDAR